MAVPNESRWTWVVFIRRDGDKLFASSIAAYQIPGNILPAQAVKPHVTQGLHLESQMGLALTIHFILQDSPFFSPEK